MYIILIFNNNFQIPRTLQGITAESITTWARRCNYVGSIRLCIPLLRK